jgi:hypothetical protein
VKAEEAAVIEEDAMRIVSRIALAAVLASAVAVPALAQGWRHHHGRHHHYGWSGYGYGYAPAVSDFYHRSRMLVGTR